MSNGFPFRSVKPVFDLATILREGFQATSTTFGASNSSGALAIGTNIGSIIGRTGHNIYIDSISMHCLIDCLIWVQRSDSSLIANLAAPGMLPVLCGPTYGNAIVPLNMLLREGEGLFFVLRSAIPSGAGTNTFEFRAGVTAYSITNDLAFEAPKTMLVIGDSISNTTGPSNGKEFWHARVSLNLKSNRNHYRRIVKGDGGWRTSHALDYLQRGGFDIADPELIMIMLGTNESILADYQANIAEIVSYLRQMFPDAKICLVGPPPRQDSVELTVLVPLRAWTQTYVDGSGDANLHFTSLGNSFDRTVDSNYVASDGAGGTRVHPTGTAHGLMATALLADWESSGFMDKL